LQQCQSSAIAEEAEDCDAAVGAGDESDDGHPALMTAAAASTAAHPNTGAADADGPDCA
jgi:hypothetical protein